jgi:HTH-type transcriptional regulator / antitoxin HipB
MRGQVRSPQELGQFIRRLRERNGVTQVELAERLGTSQRYIHELEAGKPKRADERYFELLRMLGITLIAESRDD